MLPVFQLAVADSPSQPNACSDHAVSDQFRIGLGHQLWPHSGETRRRKQSRYQPRCLRAWRTPNCPPIEVEHGLIMGDDIVRPRPQLQTVHRRFSPARRKRSRQRAMAGHSARPIITASAPDGSIAQTGAISAHRMSPLTTSGTEIASLTARTAAQSAAPCKTGSGSGRAR